MPGPIYPLTEARPESNSIGGITYDDPYQWLEQDTTEVSEWERAQQDLTGAHLRDLRSAVATALDSLSPKTDVAAPVKAGRYWFQQRRSAGASRPVLEVSTDLHEAGRRLLDPAVLAPDDEHATVMGWSPSPDGELVAYVVQSGGAEVGTIRVVRTADGELLPDAPPQLLSMVAISWFADSSGFMFTALDPTSGGFGFAIYRHRLGEAPVLEPEDVPENSYPLLYPVVSEDGRFVVAIGDPLAYRPLFIKDLKSNGAWEPFLRDLPVAVAGDFVGDELIAVTSHQAPRGRVVTIPVATATDTATWREIVPESDAVLTGMVTRLTVDGDRIILPEQIDVSIRVRILDLQGNELAVVALAEDGMVMPTAHDGELTFTFMSLTRSSGVYHYADGQVVELHAPEQHHEDLVTEFHRLTGPDGTELSYHLLYRKDLDRTSAPPALVHAYGGWNIPLMPNYSPDQVLLAKAGLLIVRPHIRGGGEYGQDWWDNGRLKNKLNTFSDLFVILDRLVADGVIHPDRLAFEGGSNGGMLAGAVTTQRPDLFRAVAGLVPVLDLLRVSTSPITLIAVKSDYGDPDDPEYAKILWSYSPYHNIEDNTEYPATLWLAGANDPRCPAWHARKMTAALQAADTSGKPQLLSIIEHAGHGSAVHGTMTTMNAEWIAFVLKELNIQLAKPRPT